MSHPTPFVLTVDIGSTSVRARILDAEIQPVEGAEHEIKRHPAPDGVEYPDQLAGTVEAVIESALQHAGDAAREIGGVAMATFVGNVMGVDARGKPATALYTYAHAGAAAEVEELRELIDADAAYEATGTPVHTSYQAPRLMWLKRNRPKEYSATAQWIDFGTWLYTRWFETLDVPASHSVASWSGMQDRNSLSWHRPTLDAIGLDEASLPKLADYDRPMTRLCRRYRKRWPMLTDTPFFLALGDGASANIGSGCGAPGAVALTMGTTGAIRAIVDRPVTPMPSGLWCYRVDKRLSLLGGSITDAGSLLDWLHGALRMRGSRVDDREIASVKPNSHGLTVLPFIRGERSPGWATDATATWHGVTASTTAADMARAALEAVTYRFVLISRLLDQTAPDLRVNDGEVVAGGAAILALPSWMQMMADATGKRIVASADRGTTSRGIAILALKAMGVIASVTDIPRANGTPGLPGEDGNGNAVYEPDPVVGERYAEGLERHNDLYSQLIGDM